MNNHTKATLFLATLLVSGFAYARDDHQMYSLDEALNSAVAKAKLDPAIPLYFGEQKYPAIEIDLGEWKTNKKTNGLNKSDKEACEWAFLSAVLELQTRAQKSGGNAVIGIKSNYKNIERSSETEYMCGSGALISGVAFKGKVVKLAK